MKEFPGLEPWQFRMTRRNAESTGRALGPYDLEMGSGSECVLLSDATDRPVGALVGFPIDLKYKECLQDAHKLDFAFDGDVDEFADKVLDRIGGLFLWIFVNGDVQRVYLDAGGTVPCVFDKDAGMVGSTATALLDDQAYDERFRREMYTRLRIEREGWFPAGLTAHDGVTRLLTNHYLDLRDFSTVRHWPKSELAPLDDPEEAVHEIVMLLRDHMEALTKHPKAIAQALTAGHETRMLLAAAKPFLNDMEFMTVVGPDRHAVDTAMAQTIAKGERLRHIELARLVATEEQRQLFIRRGGHCVVDSNAIYAPSVHPIAESHNFVGGLGGELARAFFWHDNDTPDTRFDPARLLRRFGLPDERALHGPLQEWLDALPTESGLDILDLAYVEHRMGPWSAAQFYNDPTLVRYAPLFARKSAELMLRFPAEWKRSERMPDQAVRQFWPELSNYPYNRIGTWQGIRSKLSRVREDPGIVLRKLRKMRG